MTSAATVELLVPIYLMLVLLLTGFTALMWWQSPTPTSRLSFLVFAGSSAQLVVMGIAGQDHPLIIALSTATGVLMMMPILGLLGEITKTDTPYVPWLAWWALGLVACVGLWAVGAPFEVYAMASTLGLVGTPLWRLWGLRRHLPGLSVPGRVLWACLTFLCLHALDFPFLRLNDDPSVLLFAVSAAMFGTLLAGLTAPSLAAEASARDAAAARAETAGLQRQNEAIADYVANLSHEIRNPLQAILGYGHLLREQVDAGTHAPSLVEDLEALLRSGSHLQSLVSDVLDLSKVAAGRMQLHLEPTSVEDLLADVAASTAPLVAGNDNALVLPEVDANGEVDAKRVRQCLINLVSNAAKFTRGGTIRVDFRGGRTWVFRVADDGIGMDPATLGRLFEPFVQADATTQHEYGGTGIGLALSRELAERMGGSLTATSKAGVGSEFVLAVEVGHA